MDLDDLDFLSDYLKNRDKIVLSDVEADDGDDDTNQEAPKRSSASTSSTRKQQQTQRGGATSSESKAGTAGDESNVRPINKFAFFFF